MSSLYRTPQPGLPPDAATAGEFMLTSSSSVTAGGVRVANFPSPLMKSRRGSEDLVSAYSSPSGLLVIGRSIHRIGSGCSRRQGILACNLNCQKSGFPLTYWFTVAAHPSLHCRADLKTGRQAKCTFASWREKKLNTAPAVQTAIKTASISEIFSHKLALRKSGAGGTPEG